MKQIDTKLLTPIYAKTGDDSAWPDEAVFYLMTRDGLFLCRHHRFFSSCVRARNWPSELAYHDPFLKPRYPRITRRQIEEVVGFFDRVGMVHGAEAAALVAWDRVAECTRIVIPDQLATVNRNRWGDLSPIGVEYEIPKLPDHMMLIGDIHSHVELAAYSSHVDRDDETHRAGFHIVVGRIHREPPEFHIEAVVDGTRFMLAADQVFEGYRRRRPSFNRSWLGHVRLRILGYMSQPPQSIVPPVPANPAGLVQPAITSATTPAADNARQGDANSLATAGDSSDTLDPPPARPVVEN